MVVGKEKKRGEVCKADCELARVGGILAPFHLMREGPRACSIELMMEGDLLRITKSSYYLFSILSGSGQG